MEDIMLYIGTIVFIGAILGHFVAKLKLPSIAGYVLAGIILGPSFTDLIPADMNAILAPISDLALAFLAFTVGTELFIPKIKESGLTLVIVSLIEVLITWIVVTLILWFVGMDFYMSLMLGALASSTSPAPILMIKKQFGLKSKFVDDSISICAIDDGIGIVVFGLAKSIVSSGVNGGENATIIDLTKPALVELALSLFFGVVIGLLIGYIINKFVKTDSEETNGFYLEVMFVGVVFSLTLAYFFEASTILLPLMTGFAFTNISNKTVYDRTTKVVDLFTLPFLIIFFTVAGLQIDISAIKTVWIIGIIYVIFRGVGKYLGGFIGALLCKESPEFKKGIGVLLLPLGGVEIGLALSAQEVFSVEDGNKIKLIVLTGTLVYSIFGTLGVSRYLSNPKRNIE